MKKLLMVSLLMFSTSVFAADGTAKDQKRKVAQASISCPSTIDGVVKLINQQAGNGYTACGDAARVAEACAWGSSADVQIAGAAIDVCDMQLKKITAADKKLLTSLNERCSKKCSRENDGTLCTSSIMFCQLSATQFVQSHFYSEPIN